MQTISVRYEEAPLWRVLAQVQVMMWAQRRPSGRKEFCDGVVKLYLYLLRSSHGDDFCYASPATMADKFGVHIRTIERWLSQLIDAGFITRGQKFVGCMRRGFYINAHSLIVALFSQIKGIRVRLHEDGNDEISVGENIPELLGEKRQVVGKLPPQLTIRKGESRKNLPPNPPQAGDAADAAKEKNHEQKTETYEPPEECRPEHFKSSMAGESEDSEFCCRFSGDDGLRLNRAAAGSVDGNGLRGEQKTLQRTATAVRTEEAGAAGRSLTPKVWQAARALLCQQLSKSDADLWIRPISACQTSGGLRLDCPDRYAMAWVQEHFGTTIRDALQHAGATDFFFTFGEKAKELQKEKEENARTATAQKAARKAEELASLSLEAQFAALVEVYPRKTSGSWFAWRTFRRLSRQQELPPIYNLLHLIEMQKHTEDWNRDKGRWIPGLNKWLKNKPWWEIDCSKERRKEPRTPSSWNCQGSIHI